MAGWLEILSMPEKIAPPPVPPPGLRRAGIGAGLLAIAVVASGLALRAHDLHGAENLAAAAAIPGVRLIAPGGTGTAQPLVLPATMEAWTAARIFARVPGYVRGWRHDIGDRVEAGTALGAIDTPELDQQIIEARASVERASADRDLARTTAMRWSSLLASHSVSQQETDEKNGAAVASAAALGEARAALGRLLAMKAYATVRAPFAGIVTARNADIGDLVGPGASTQQPLFAMADERHIRIYVNVPQQYSAAMRAGLAATVTVPEYPGREFPAAVAGTSGAINSQTGAQQVQLVTDNPRGLLKAGGYARVSFDLSPPAGSVSLPATALVLRGGSPQVATVDRAGRVRLVAVTIGRDLGQTVEITAGIAAAARVIDNPPDSLFEGEQVRVENPGHG